MKPTPADADVPNDDAVAWRSRMRKERRSRFAG
jgi:hypothetical protein